MTTGVVWPSWTEWHFGGSAYVAAALGLIGLVAYWSHLSPRQRRLLGVALALFVALLASDVQSLSMSSYPCHMIDHLIVILVIAPLVAAAVEHPLGRTGSTLGILSFTVLIPLYHLTALGGWVMSHPGGHYVEIASFFVVGVWFWVPVYGARRVMSDQQRVTYAILAWPVVVTTGLVLWSSSTSSVANVGMNMARVSLTDIHEGGLVMMLLGGVLMGLHVMGIVTDAAIRHQARRTPVGWRYAP